MLRQPSAHEIQQSVVFGRVAGILRKIIVREGVRVEAGSVVGLFEQQVPPALFAAGTGAEEQDTLSNPTQLPAGTVALFMPALSSTMTQGTITKWHKQEGDKIEASAH